MGLKIEKLAELQYDELVTLGVIEQDKDLSSIFIEDINMSFNVLRSLSIEGKLSKNTKERIFEYFDKIIITKKSLIEKYIRLSGFNPITTEITEPVVETPKKKRKPKRDVKLPRRYGKDNILQDIEKQGGKPTNAQLTALELNALKNIYIKLNARLINDMLTDKPILTDEDYRDIRATITLLNNRLKNILKKK